MNDPIAEIPSVIRTLVQGSPREQQDAVETYFTQDASFTHPFCRTGRFDTSYGTSRDLISAIYRWYKIMSPEIPIQINSIAFDKDSLLLYVNVSQVFSIWVIPFHRSPVTFDTKLELTRSSATGKYFIKSQSDLYPVDQWVKFFAPWGIGIAVVLIWQFWATALCVLGAAVFAPVTRLEEAAARRHRIGRGLETNGLTAEDTDQAGRREERVKRWMALDYGDGEGKYVDSETTAVTRE